METPPTPPKRRMKVPGCETCETYVREYGGIGPPHDASDRCESGKRPHCSCDTCF